MEKAKLMQVIDELPEQVNIDALTERLYLLEKIEFAEKQIAAGQGVPHEEAKKRLARWLT